MGKRSKSEIKSAAAPSKSKIDPSLASLFRSSFGAVQAPRKEARGSIQEGHVTAGEETGGNSDSPEDASDQAQDGGEGHMALQVPKEKKRKRKRRDNNDDVEGVYMKKLHDPQGLEDKPRKLKKSRTNYKEEKESESNEEGKDNNGGGSGEEGPPIRHETLAGPKEVAELEKSARTVFLGNVPSIVISSKPSYKILKTHLRAAGKVVSIRFRSIAFSEQIPRKAAFITHKLHEKQQTVNAYVVYSTPAEVRSAVKLNSNIILDRHIRVDSVAHPTPQDSKRCVFIGNLDFEAQEESLWRHFARCGKVESVRVVRDAKTNVGKGFAYVQFEDSMSVDEALLLDGKKMANDRKLRVTRAKNLKRNQVKKPERRHPEPTPKPGHMSVYVPKVDPKRKDTVSRAHKLLGRAGAAQLKSQGEVFEGLRATAQTDSGIRKGGSGKKKGKARARVSARTASWKQKTRKEST